jgi:arylformamidase
MNKVLVRALWAALVFSCACEAAFAGPLRDRLMERKGQQASESLDEGRQPYDTARLPGGVRLLPDLVYGDDSQQRLDVYAPQHAKGAPVIFMVHGGAWKWGDKASSTVVENKVSRWVTRGFIFISVNYRLLPKAGPLQQAADVSRALSFAQARAGSWGGDPAKFILMGHSAGAHLVALLAAAPAAAKSAGVRPWLGTILLDSAALDVEPIMKAWHFRFYDEAFGGEPSFWQSASPLHVLSSPASPILAVCSSRRKDSCPQARAFAAKAASLGGKVSILEQDLSHRDINKELGAAGAYTTSVEDFMGSLDRSVQNMLR